MTRVHLLCAAAALSLVPAALAAQVPGPSVPTGVPGSNPYASPDGIDSRAGRTMPTEADRLAIDERAADARAAQEARGGRAVPARASDIVAQAIVSDSSGQPVGTIETVEADGAVVVTAAGKVKVPLDAFGKNRKGLLIGMTKRDFEALVAKANDAPAG
jgi:hypothetical protein